MEWLYCQRFDIKSLIICKITVPIMKKHVRASKQSFAEYISLSFPNYKIYY